MAIENIPDISYDVQDNPGSTSIGSDILRKTLMGLSQAPNILGFPGTVLNAGWNAIQQHVDPTGQTTTPGAYPDLSTIRRGIGTLGEKVGLPQGYLEPKGDIEEMIASTGSDLPFIIMSGGAPLYSRALKSILNTGTMKGIEKMGGGALAQLGGAALVGGLSDFAKKGGAGRIEKTVKDATGKEIYRPATKTRLFAKEAQEAAYKGAGEHGNFPVKTGGLEGRLFKIADKARRGVGAEEYKKFLADIKTFTNDIKHGSIPAKDLLDYRRRFNETYGKISAKDQALKDFYKEAGDEVRGLVEEAKKQSSKFGEHVSRADELTAALHKQSKIRDYLEKAPDITDRFASPLTKALLTGSTSGLGIGSLMGTIPAAVGGAAVGAGATMVVRSAARLVDLMSSPTIRKHVMNIGKNAMLDQHKALAFNAMKLDKDLLKMTRNDYDPDIVPYD